LYNLDEALSCSWDCQSRGSYCGDGSIDTAEGETCDDGNRQSADGCNASCQLEQTACIDERPLYKVFDGNTYISLEALVYESISVFDTTVVPAIAENAESTEFIEGEPYEGCSQNITGDDICESYGLTCNAFIEVVESSIENFSALYSYDSCDFDFSELQMDWPSHQYVLSCKGEFSGYINEVNPEEVDSIPGCGNGAVDTGEQCDIGIPGTKTIVGCTSTSLEYGGSCTYCSSACLIETVESQAFCGNGEIDQIGIDEEGVGIYEACDATGSTVYVPSDAVNFVESDGFAGSLGGTTVQIDSKLLGSLGGNSVEVNSCTDIVNPATEGIAYEQGDVSCLNDCTVLDTTQCLSCGVINGAPRPELLILNPIANNVGVIDSNLTGYEFFNIGFVMNFHEDAIIVNTKPMIFASFSGLYSNEFQLVDQQGIHAGIETNAQCSGSCLNGECSSGYAFSFAHEGEDTPGDEFAYTVNGLPLIQKNEFVLSPAVPEGSLRVVVRWDTPNNTNGGFFGGWYQANGSEVSEQQLYAPGSTIGDMCSSFVITESGYWLPAPGCTTSFGSFLQVHPQRHATFTHIQSYTISPDDLESTQPIAFFVQHAGLSPIYEYQNTEHIVVDVYTYREEQDATYSVYNPAFSFTLSESIKSANAGAEYWHVFDLIRDEDLLESEALSAVDIPGSSEQYTLVPVKTVRRSDCEIHNSLYEDGRDCVQEFLDTL